MSTGIYVCSDIHAFYTLFINSIPKDYKKLIIDGDTFNKGFENREILFWSLDNVHNNKIINIFGNHEVLLASQLYSLYKDKITVESKYDIYRICNKLTKNINNENYRTVLYNHTKIAAGMINSGVISLDNITDYFNSLKFYHIEKTDNYEWYISHGAWIPFEDQISKHNIPKLKEIIYDLNNKFLNSVIKENDRNINSYTKWCIKNNRKHIFGHWPVDSAFNKTDINDLPVVINNTYYYIDPNVKRMKQVYFFEIF